MATTNQRIRYDLEAAVSGQQDVAAGGLFRRAWDTVRLWFH